MTPTLRCLEYSSVWDRPKYMKNFRGSEGQGRIITGGSDPKDLQSSWEDGTNMHNKEQEKDGVNEMLPWMVLIKIL